jgi:hypothetical protein
MNHLDPSSVSFSLKSIPDIPGVGGLLWTSSEGSYGTYLSSSDPVGGGSRYGAGVFADAIVVPVGAGEVTAASSSSKEASVAEVSTYPINSQRNLFLISLLAAYSLSSLLESRKILTVRFLPVLLSSRLMPEPSTVPSARVTCPIHLELKTHGATPTH